ncbi:MAG: ABC transporter permease subunit [Devosia sp.]
MTETTTEIAPAVVTGRFAAQREFWHYFARSRGALIGLVVFVLLLLVAAFAPWLSPYDPVEQYKQYFLLPPSWAQGGRPEFLLGTDPVGRDILSRLIYGARYSLLIGFVTVALALSVGVILGLVAGYFRGSVDAAIMRVMDLILAFPYLLLALVLVTVLGPGLNNAMLALAITLLPFFARLTRGAVMTEKTRDYVTSARLAGASDVRLMVMTILPNCLAPLIVQATLCFSDAILGAAALGFLGLGAQPPTPEWGTMLANAREFIQRAPWVVTLPGLCILVTVLAINLIGDGLRDALDPKLKRS